MLAAFPGSVIEKIQQWQRRLPLQISRENVVNDEWNTKAIKSLVKKLKEKRGERGVAELELALSKQNADSPCVTIPRTVDGRLQISSRKALPHLIYVRIFRYPDLVSHNQIQSTDNCPWGFHAKRDQVCINPYHYERILPTPQLRPVRIKRSAELLPRIAELASPASTFLQQQTVAGLFYEDEPVNIELEDSSNGQQQFSMNGQPLPYSPVEMYSATSEYGSDESAESTATDNFSHHRNSWTSDMSSSYSPDPPSSQESQASDASVENYSPVYSPAVNHVQYYQA